MKYGIEYYLENKKRYQAGTPEVLSKIEYNIFVFFLDISNY